MTDLERACEKLGVEPEEYCVLRGMDKSPWWERYLVAPALYRADDGIVLCTDAKYLLSSLPAFSVNMVMTDPDYSRGDRSGYRDLAQYAPGLMNESSIMIIEVPHRYLPGILWIMEMYGSIQDLRWWWLHGFDYSLGSQRRLAMGIHCMYKPLACYIKGKSHRRGYVRDHFQVEPVKRTKHRWQKGLDGYKYYIEKYTKPGDVVLDPFCGSGTTAFACRELGRRFVVGDHEERHVRRLAEELEAGNVA